MLNIRKATKSDIELLIKLRFDYLTTEFGELTPEESDKLNAQLSEYFPKHIEDDFIAVIGEIDGKVVGNAFMVISERPANPRTCATGKTAAVYNVLTYPEYRRQGIATNLLKILIDEAKKANAVFVELSASSMGKPVYEKLGFTEKTSSNYTDMKLKLN